MNHRLVAAVMLAGFMNVQATTVRLGLNLATLRTEDAPGLEAGYRPAVHLAFLHEAPVKAGVWQIGVGYDQRGGTLDLRFGDEDIGFLVDMESAYRLDYVTLPMGMQFEDRANPGTRPFLALRAVPSLLVRARGDAEGRFVFGDAVSEIDEENQDILDESHRFDLLLEGEAGASIPLQGSTRLLVGAGLGYGLFNIPDPDGDGSEEEEGEEQEDLKSLLFRVFVGVAF